MWHACGGYSIEGFLEGKGGRARELFEGFERLNRRLRTFMSAPSANEIVIPRSLIAFTSPGVWYGHWIRGGR